MKDKNAKYLILGYGDIYKQLYDVKREATFNDFENFYTPTHKIDISPDFSRYGVPVNFRKVVLKKNAPFLIKGSLEEYVLGFSFDVLKNNSRGIEGVNQPVFYDNQCFYNKYTFSSSIDFVSYESVISFLQEIKDNGYLKNYICALNSFFDMYLNVDECFETYGDVDDVKRFVKEFRKSFNR